MQKIFRKGKSLWFIILTVLVSGLFGSSAIGSDTIRLGIVYSLSGTGAAMGEQQLEGAKMAINDINDAGGVTIDGKQIRIDPLYRDDASQSETALKRLDELVNSRKVTAIVGGTLAEVSMALNDASKQTPVFFMATNLVPERFYTRSAKSPTALGIMGAEEWLGRGAAAYIADKMKAKKITNFLPDNADGKSVLNGFEAVIKTKEKVKYTTIWQPAPGMDLTSYFEKVRKSKPKVLFVSNQGSGAADVLKQGHEKKITKKMKIYHGFMSNSLATAVPADVLRYITGQTFWYHDLSEFEDDEELVKAVDAFVEKYMGLHDSPPGAYTVMAYYGVKETVRAMQLANSTEPEKLVAALMGSPKWSGAKGPAQWRKDGSCLYQYGQWVIQGKPEKKRKSERFTPQYDYAKIIDFYGADVYAPPLNALGY